MIYCLVIMLLVIQMIGIGIRLYTRRIIKNMDGIGELYKSNDTAGRIIAKF